MKTNLQWILTVSFFGLILAVVMQMPQWIHMHDARFQGIAINLNSDEAVYLARVEEALSGRPEQTAEAFTGHANLKGTQFAMIERLYGTVFRFTGWRAAHVLTLLDVLVPVVLFFSLVYFFSLCGFSRSVSLGLAVAFCVLQLYNLNRPIHMRSSFLIMLWTIIFIRLSVIRNTLWMFPAGFFLGLLVGVYVWSFMFAWAVWGVYFAWEFSEWLYGKWVEHKKHSSRLGRLLHSAKSVVWHFRPRKPSWQLMPWHTLLLVGVLGVLSAVPFIAQYIILKQHPLYVFGEFRSGMHPGHLPESIPYSVIFVGAATLTAVAFAKRYESLKQWKFAITLLLAACVYMNQQLLHGVTFNFVSHGIFSLLLAALATVGVALSTKDWWLKAAAALLTVYMLAIGYDGRFVLGQWTIEASKFSNQHLAEALPVLDELPRGRFTSDPSTLAFIAGYTHHDVVYSVYLKNVLMSHSEIAVRYCLTQIPDFPANRHIAETQHMVMPDAVSAFKGDTREKEVALVEAACREVDLDPALALETHEVNYVFWNKDNQPDWDIRRFGVNLEEVAGGESWTLYRISL